MEVTLTKDGRLSISIETNNPPEVSKSGKTLLVATTHGSMTTKVQVNGKPLIVNLSAYVPVSSVG